MTNMVCSSAITSDNTPSTKPAFDGVALLSQLTADLTRARNGMLNVLWSQEWAALTALCIKSLTDEQASEVIALDTALYEAAQNHPEMLSDEREFMLDLIQFSKTEIGSKINSETRRQVWIESCNKWRDLLTK